MLNFSIYEDGNGGQQFLSKTDVQQTESLATLAYLAMFKGNVASSTERGSTDKGINLDWWGNASEKAADRWINSETEKVLRGSDTSMAALYRIEAAAKKDTESLKQYGAVEVAVSFPGVNKVEIHVTITEQDVEKSDSLKVIWDASRNEVIQKITL